MIKVNNKVEYFQNCCQLAGDMDGTFVEMGFGKGGSATTFAGMIQREMWLFDSFKGFPAPTKEDYAGKKCYISKGDWAVPLNIATKLQASSSNKVHVIPGYFEDTVSKYNAGPIAILHLDCDLYMSYKVCLEALYSQVAEGGVIMFDEYKSPKQLQNYPGASKAIDEFFTDKAETIQEVRLMDGSDNWIKYFTIKTSNEA